MMTPIDRLSQVGSTTALSGAGSLEAGAAARELMGSIGDRVAAWSGEIFGGARSGGSGGFTPNTAELAQRGDVYGLRSLVSDTASRFGAGPAAEGELLRAAEDFTRAAALHIFGADRQDAVTAALDGAQSDGNGIDGVVGHLEAATRDLRANAGS